MRRINVVLILSLLISSCGQNELTNSSKETKSRSKRELREEQVVVKKTAEETLREKLSEEESKGLNFLKEALGDESKLNQILSLDESKVKEALKHINDELAKCSGDNASQQKETFKEVVKGALNGNNDLDQFKSQASSTCNAGAGG
ncbi:Mlp family lipoprotein (plasmid) [Borrelia miyamotoi]|uniref:Mlp family lipoprotein n=1 Tax=Borrelia miyamotoi TaxID=47466 RepID=A0A5P8AXM3_9SPIR|nr:Mlp family lipoprotein [Borrelia miyamotoi]WAZ72653.1 Mlp family lipoprotein [Borrelia miyamotoi]WAZ72735.1 Mlp family lipoprotein [Borrelia miyamotoi]WVI05605.1 Mlp family lipoprotein [Borrelia miyamotoi]